MGTPGGGEFQRIASTKGLGQECARVCMRGTGRGEQNSKRVGTWHPKLRFGSGFNLGLGRDEIGVQGAK